MKESEAKEKWCPMGEKEDRTYSPCLASGCMWWVWDDENQDTGERLQPRTHGHCGHIPRARRICISRRGEVTHIPDHLIIEYRPGEEWRTVTLGEEE